MPQHSSAKTTSRLGTKSAPERAVSGPQGGEAWAPISGGSSSATPGASARPKPRLGDATRGGAGWVQQGALPFWASCLCQGCAPRWSHRLRLHRLQDPGLCLLLPSASQSLPAPGSRSCNAGQGSRVSMTTLTSPARGWELPPAPSSGQAQPQPGSAAAGTPGGLAPPTLSSDLPVPATRGRQA